MRIFIFCQLIILTFCFSCSEKVETFAPTIQDITESVYASGTIRSDQQYQVFPRTQGIITEILVKEGEKISKGQVLAKIENRAADLNVENALLTAQNKKFENNQQKLEELQKTIEISKNKLKNDSVLYVRQQNLWAQQIGSKTELDMKELTYKTSKSNYQSTLLKYSDLKRELKFSSELANKNVSLTKTSKDDLLIKSLIDGTVYNILKEVGESINTSLPFATVGSVDSFIIDLQVDEFDIMKIQIGQNCYITMDSKKGEVFEAKVVKIHPIMNQKTRTFKVEAAFTNDIGVIYPNLSLEANIVINQKKNALTIPRNLVFKDSFVFMVGGLQKPISVGLKDYNTVEVLNGLQETDKIIMPK